MIKKIYFKQQCRDERNIKGSQISINEYLNIRNRRPNLYHQYFNFIPYQFLVKSISVLISKDVVFRNEYIIGKVVSAKVSDSFVPPEEMTTETVQVPLEIEIKFNVEILTPFDELVKKGEYIFGINYSYTLTDLNSYEILKVYSDETTTGLCINMLNDGNEYKKRKIYDLIKVYCKDYKITELSLLD